MMRKTLILLLICFSTTIWAQSIERQVIGNAGGNFTLANFNVNFTVGEAVIHSFLSGNFIVTQGFHQGDLTTRMVNIGEEDLSSFISIYPNPVRDLVNIEVLEDLKSQNLSVRLFDLQGRELIHRQFGSLTPGGSILQLNMTQLEAGSYQLLLERDSKPLGVVMLIKIE